MNGFNDKNIQRVWEDAGLPANTRLQERFESIMFEFLDRWYLPRPTDKNGNPIKLGNFVGYQGEEPDEVLAMEHHYMGWSLLGADGEFTDNPESYEICEPDSIEKLRDDMAWELQFTGEDPKPNYGLVDEWLKRAEKLFKEAM